MVGHEGFGARPGGRPFGLRGRVEERRLFERRVVHLVCTGGTVKTVDLTYLNYAVAAVVVYYLGLYVHLTVRRMLRGRMEETDYRPYYFVVVPAHNEEVVIAHTIESLLRQDYEHVAIMVMNDGSKDRTSEIAHEYARQYDSVIVVDRGPDVAGRGKGACLLI
ncbi:MAG: glycosyltransferase, partial [Actinobacteria bacterium]